MSLGALNHSFAQDNKPQQAQPSAPQSAPAQAPAPVATEPAAASTPVSGVVQQQKPIINDLKQQTKSINDQLQNLRPAMRRSQISSYSLMVFPRSCLMRVLRFVQG
ncbi:hypothetical protein AB664_08555 [Brucella anthropi]|uniref:Uncharacterized protein n=1 Tax=Brucella anthropi TaxID=529 RepID=A0A656Z5D8_BRUAN|nr:hypothetical protein AB664_08555 [Brucella anthropi]